MSVGVDVHLLGSFVVEQILDAGDEFGLAADDDEAHEPLLALPERRRPHARDAFASRRERFQALYRALRPEFVKAAAP